MSLASFPPKEVVYDVDTSCDPAKIVLTFRGTPSAPLGHSIDPAPPPPLPLGKRRPRAPRVLQYYSNKEEEQKKAENGTKNEVHARMRREEFIEKGVLQALYGEVEQKVQCACMSTDHLLLQKRTRLRELLLAEEVAYTTEYIAKCQQAQANREEDLRTRASEMKAKIERERKEFADLKLLEQKLISCDAARPTLTKKQLLELKKDQLWQIREKYALEEAKREEERMYHDLMMKNVQAIKEDEEENAKLVWKKQKDAQKAFIEQMKWKEQKEEQERQLKEYERLKLEEEIEQLKGEEAKEKAEQMQKKEKIKAEFKEILERDRALKEKRKKEEEEIDRTFSKLMKIEEEKEKTKMASNKERLKREMDIFLKKSRELRQLKEEEERKFEEMLAELNEKKQKQKDAERRRLKEAKEELFQNVLRERQDQLREKKERERREEEQHRAEIQLLTLQLEQQDRIREEYERKCAEQRKEYRCQLLQQMEEAEEARRRKKAEEEQYLKEMKAKEEKEIEEVKAMLQALPIFPKDHPMKVLARDHPPKYPCMHPYL